VAVKSKLFVATDHGLFRLEEAQGCWALQNETMGSPPLQAVAHYGDSGLIAASDSGIWIASDVSDARLKWERLRLVFFNQISDVWSDRDFKNAIFVGTTSGALYYTSSPEKPFSFFAFSTEKIFYNGVTSFAPYIDEKGQFQLFFGSNMGVFYAYDNIEHPVGVAAWVDNAGNFYRAHSDDWWFWPVTTVVGFAGSYALGLAALLLLLWMPLPPILGRVWLISLIAKPLTISPPLGRWALFLGYRRRLAKEPMLTSVTHHYFGLTARLSDGKETAADSTGKILHAHLKRQLGGSNCVVLTGRPGTGKSTVLAKFAQMCIEKSNDLPDRRLLPILIPADYYKGSLVEAASRVLREKYGVPLDKSEMLEGQMQSGRLLFLFDGLSEVVAKAEAREEISQVTRLAEHKRCLFVIATRPLQPMPEMPVFELQPLTYTAIENLYLPTYQLSKAEEQLILSQLRVFGSGSIDALLFSMMIAATDATVSTPSRTQLFERYFRKLLKTEKDEKDLQWVGWRTALEHIAGWFALETGIRSRGLVHVKLMDHLVRKDVRNNDLGLVEYVRLYFNVQVSNELDLLEQVLNAGILTGRQTWRFAHDAFEEYFCASRLVHTIEENGKLPILDGWLRAPTEFVETLHYFAELASPEVTAVFFAAQVPEIWKASIRKSDMSSDHSGSA
jgi:hypothetical protein